MPWFDPPQGTSKPVQARELVKESLSPPCFVDPLCVLGLVLLHEPPYSSEGFGLKSEGSSMSSST